MPDKQIALQDVPSFSLSKEPGPKIRQGQKKRVVRRHTDTQDYSGHSGSSPPTSPQQSQSAPWQRDSATLLSPARKREASSDPRPSRSNKQGRTELNSPTTSVVQALEGPEIAPPKIVAQSGSMAPFVRVPLKNATSGSARKNGAQSKEVDQFANAVDESLASKGDSKQPSQAAWVPQLQKDDHSLAKQPHTHTISLEHLASEIKAIYHGLCIVETKLYVVTNEWNEKFDEWKKKGEEPNEMDDIWPTYIGLCRTYLHEHNDFLLATGHPIASDILHGLAAKYNMAARLWKWGIHSPLELMRRRLPSSREWMMTYWTIAYQMLGLLLETVDEFEPIWLECLGDMSRYKMAIEDGNSAEREHYAEVAYDWYARTADTQPGVGRVFHHQAVLCRRQPLRQLGLYCLALTSLQPFLCTHESMSTLCRSAISWPMKGATDTYATWLVHGLAALFIDKNSDVARKSFSETAKKMPETVKKEAENYRHAGIWTMFILITGIMDFGLPENELRKSFARITEEFPTRREQSPSTATNLEIDREGSAVSLNAFTNIVRIALDLAMNNDMNVLALLNVATVFIYSCSLVEISIPSLPLRELVRFLNWIDKSMDVKSRQDIIQDKKFPFSHAGDSEGKNSDETEHVMLLEDHYLSGKDFLPKDYWPRPHLANASSTIDSRFIEQFPVKFANYRKTRIFYTGVQIATKTDLLDLGADGFSIGSGFANTIMSGAA